MSRRNTLLLLAVIVLIGVGLRSWQLTGRSLWFDEAFSWRLVQFPVTELIARDAADVHPPLYYLVLKVWTTVFGTSLLALRSFSVALAGVTIAAGYLLAVEVMRVRGSPATLAKARWAGLITAVLIAVSGFQIQYAWEARMYTLGTALTLISSWLLLRALRAEPQRVSRWLTYGIVTALFAYVHYYALFSIVAHVVFILGWLLTASRFRLGEILQDRRLWGASLAGAAMLILYLPWIPTFIAQNSQVQDNFWIPQIGGWSIPDTFYRMLAPTPSIPQHTGVFWIILAALPITLTILLWFLLPLVRSNYAKTRDGHWLILAAGVVPFLCSIALSFIGQSLYQDRFFVFAHLYILIGLSLVIVRLPWLKLQQVFVVLLIVFSLAAFGALWTELNIVERPGAHAAAQAIFTERQPDEPVLVSSPFVYFAILHYAQEEFGLSGEELPRLITPSGELLHFAGGPIQTTEDFVSPEIFETPARKLWMVDTTGFGERTYNVPASWAPTNIKIFNEVFEHQGVVAATQYQK